jgi:hypothetical protein
MAYPSVAEADVFACYKKPKPIQAGPVSQSFVPVGGYYVPPSVTYCVAKALELATGPDFDLAALQASHDRLDDL